MAKLTSADPHHALLLPFQRAILSSILPSTSGSTQSAPSAVDPLAHAASQTDGLVLLARGLGLRTIVSAFLKVYDDPTNLVLVVNATPEEEKGMAEELGMRLKVVGFEMGAKERPIHEGVGVVDCLLPTTSVIDLPLLHLMVACAARQDLYKSGGILSVTSRILVVDLLHKRMPIELITGLVILHAETVTPTSTEAFIVRVYRDHNKIGFLKGFSDEPEHFTYGIAPLQNVLTQLKVRQVYIWPRFHADVQRDLEIRKADVVELHQPLSESMDELQTAIIECMDATLAEIKRSNTTLEVEDFTVENALFKSFDAIVRTQLDPVWHRVGPKTRQLVGDLTMLRRLLSYLLSFDSVSFNRFLETILLANSSNPTTGQQKQHKSPWLFMDAADTIFTVARSRVYKKVDPPPPTIPAAPLRSEGDEDYWHAGGPSIEEEEILAALETAERARPASGQQTDTMTAATATSSPVRNAGSGDIMQASSMNWLPPGVQPVLEEQPKWHLLSDVLEEIENDLQFADKNYESPSNDTILVMCSSTAACSTIREYLSTMDDFDPALDGAPSPNNASTGGQKMMRRRLRDYFWWKGSLGKMARNLRSGPGNRSTMPETSAGGGIFAKQGKVDDNYESPALKRKAEYRRGMPPSKKRRRVRGGSTAALGGVIENPSSTNDVKAKGGDSSGLEKEAGEVADIIDQMAGAESLPGAAATGADAIQDDVTDAFDELAFAEYFGLLSMEDLVIVRPYNGDDDDRMLDELRPKYIVLFDPDPAFIRRIEVYRSSHQGLAVRVYFLMYAGSVEEQRYLSSIRREKESFERLIKERSVMALTLDVDRRPGDQSDDELLRTISSRIGGGGKSARADPPRVIVDVREFRSSLPSLLHAANFQVIPLTLTTGDYILSPTMCVERKSIPDLIQSFNSGRLYQQCELMAIHYEQPILLIEFDQKKSFSLETYADPKPATSAASSEVDLHSKLVLLTLTFPRLRIIWSSSPYATSDIFADLKHNHDEPDPDRAALVGSEDIGANGAGGGTEGAYNLAPQEILRSLPGITTKNYRYVMAKIDNLEELCEMSQEGLGELIGVEAGKTLWTFLNRNVHKE